MSLRDDIDTVQADLGFAAHNKPGEDTHAEDAFARIVAQAIAYEQTEAARLAAVRVAEAASWLHASRGARNEESAWRLLEAPLSDYKRVAGSS